MDLLTYFLISMSVAATLAIVLLVGVLGVGLWLVMWLKTAMKKFDQLAAATTEMADSIKTFVTTTTERAVAWEKMFLTAQGLQQVASQFAEVFHRRKKEVKSQLLNKKGETL